MAKREIRFQAHSYKGADGSIRVFCFPTFSRLRPELTQWVQRESQRSDIFMLEDQRFGSFDIWMADGGNKSHRLFGFMKGVNPLANDYAVMAVRRHFAEMRRIQGAERAREINRRLDAEEADRLASVQKKQDEVAEYCATEAVTYGGRKSVPSVVISNRSAQL